MTTGALDTKIEIREKDSDEMRLVSSVFNWMTLRIQTLIENARGGASARKTRRLRRSRLRSAPFPL